MHVLQDGDDERKEGALERERRQLSVLEVTSMQLKKGKDGTAIGGRGKGRSATG